MESVPHLKPLESYSEVKSSTDLLRNPRTGVHRKTVGDFQAADGRVACQARSKRPLYNSLRPASMA